MATLALPPRRRIQDERIFFSGMTLLILASVFVGYGSTFYLKGAIPASRPVPPLNSLVILHGVVFSSWIVLSLAQTWLVAAGRTDLHRKFGMTLAALAVAMVPLGFFTGVYAMQRPTNPPGLSPESWLAIPLFALPPFIGLVIAGIVARRHPQAHKRYMLGAMVWMLGPAIGRLPMPAWMPMPLILFGGPDLAMIAMIGFDLSTRGKVYSATMVTAAVFLASEIAPLAVWQSGPWIAFARAIGRIAA
ncbi:hypothetical protein BH09PSE4_BH09PSE4_20470 [soil metagenome]